MQAVPSVPFDCKYDCASPMVPWLLIWILCLVTVGLVFAAQSRFLMAKVWAYVCYAFAAAIFSILILWALNPE